MPGPKGRIFNIHTCSIRDGRGMRTTVFFKGCGLRCLWCANPESIEYANELSLNPALCIGCGLCARFCPEHAITGDGTGRIVKDPSLCISCGSCAEVCPTEARKYWGRDYTVEEAFRVIYQDHFYFRHSGGGVTFSGGEALLQAEFLLELCKKCREYHVNVAIETCGCGRYENFRECLDYTDFIYFDLKHMDSGEHRKITGKGNESILENLCRMNEHGKEICVRTPVVPGWNDSEENIRKTAEFIAPLENIQKYELLAYHRLGISKYKILGKPFLLEDVTEPASEHMLELVETANKILLPLGKKCFYNADNNADE